MKISVIAVGRMKSGPEQVLADRYLDRFAKSGGAVGLDFGGLSELAEGRARSADERKRDEGHRIRDAAGASALVLLDERGKNLSSEDFAAWLGQARDGGRKGVALAIGGADGHDPALRAEAALTLSFGAQTWPHQMVRIMLAEQLYRAVTILSGHPYHRS